MDAKKFYEEFGKEEATQVAIAAGTNLDYFKQIMYGNRLPSHKLTVKLEESSGGRMTRKHLRPDIYGDPSEKAA